MSYGDYQSNPMAFAIGYEHFLDLSKKPKQLIGYIFHGFLDEETGEVQVQ
jgi:hypothetical protein